METKLTPEQWTRLFGMKVYHNILKECELGGVRVKCESNNNLMLLVINSDNEYFWVYDYETKVITSENILTNDGEAIQSFVSYESVNLHRVGNNFYLNASGCTYSLKESEVIDLMAEISIRDLYNPLTAAEFLISQQNRFVRISP